VDFIIPIKGNVKHPITMDASVWIFDDRRLDLNTFFDEKEEILTKEQEEEAYKERMGKFWSREIMEGATSPPTLQSEKAFEEKEAVEGTLGMYIYPFFYNAEPAEDAKHIIFETTTGKEHVLPIEEIENIIFQFSYGGQPLREDGPVYALLKDGSNRHNPIKHINALRVE